MNAYTIKSTPPLYANENTLLCRERGLPTVQGLHTGPHWSVVAGGPSMKGCEPTDNIVAINGAHDALIARGIIPKYCMLNDSLPHIATIVAPHKDVTYLVASQCAPELFDLLEDYDVRVWYASVKDNAHFLPEEQPLVVGGGQTVNRTLALGYYGGVREWDYYGFDSSYENEEHGYDSPHGVGTPGPNNHMVGYDGWDGPRHYKSSLPLMTQAVHFMTHVKSWKAAVEEGLVDDIKIAIHGDGLVPYIWESMVKNG